MLTHGDRDCDRWLRSKGTLRREEQQYGAWLRAVVDRPIRRVKVKGGAIKYTTVGQGG
jgi:hypothetical protein